MSTPPRDDFDAPTRGEQCALSTSDTWQPSFSRDRSRRATSRLSVVGAGDAAEGPQREGTAGGFEEDDDADVTGAIKRAGGGTGVCALPAARSSRAILAAFVSEKRTMPPPVNAEGRRSGSGSGSVKRAIALLALACAGTGTGTGAGAGAAIAGRWLAVAVSVPSAGIGVPPTIPRVVRTARYRAAAAGAETGACVLRMTTTVFCTGRARTAG